MRQIPQPEEMQDTEAAAATAVTGVRLQVNAFKIVGNTLLDTASLQRTLEGFTNRPMDFGQLQTAVAAVIDRYKRSGWVVRAFLPKQEIEDGLVTIQVVEAAFGGTRIEVLSAPRVPLAQIEKLIDAQQHIGQPLNAEALDRALLLVDDLPGVAASGDLAEGQQAGQTQLLLRLNSKPLVQGDAELDNTGSRSTGPERLSVNLGINSPFMVGDLLSANLIASEGSDYLRLDATVPVGSDGWRVGVNASSLHYKILLDSFAALDAKGSSDSIGLEVSYPLVRSRLHNLYFSGNLDSRSYDNRANGLTSSNYRSNNLSLGLWGNAFDRFAGGGANSASLTWTAGQLDLAGSPNQSADAASTDTEGNFSKLRYSFARQQTLTDDLLLYATLSGQWADKNLDSSEKFYLGGASGVRAYPSNEAGGANGQLLNLELRQYLPQGFHVSVFYDVGTVSTNVNNHYASAPSSNDSTLQGYGLGLAWQHSKGLNLKLLWSRRAGSNPNPTASGSDQDGSLDLDRWWFTASLPF